MPDDGVPKNFSFLSFLMLRRKPETPQESSFCVQTVLNFSCKRLTSSSLQPWPSILKSSPMQRINRPEQISSVSGPLQGVGSSMSSGLLHHSEYTATAQMACASVLSSRRLVVMPKARREMHCAPNHV